jgi:hypothetical protein
MKSPGASLPPKYDQSFIGGTAIAEVAGGSGVLASKWANEMAVAPTRGGAMISYERPGARIRGRPAAEMVQKRGKCVACSS